MCSIVGAEYTSIPLPILQCTSLSQQFFSAPFSHGIRPTGESLQPGSPILENAIVHYRPPFRTAHPTHLSGAPLLYPFAVRREPHTTQRTQFKLANVWRPHAHMQKFAAASNGTADKVSGRHNGNNLPNGKTPSFRLIKLMCIKVGNNCRIMAMIVLVGFAVMLLLRLPPLTMHAQHTHTGDTDDSATAALTHTLESIQATLSMQRRHRHILHGSALPEKVCLRH